MGRSWWRFELMVAFSLGWSACGVDGDGTSTSTGTGTGTGGGGGGTTVATSTSSTGGSTGNGGAGGGGPQPLVGLWSGTPGGTGADRITSVATDAAGQLFITGEFFGTADFGGGPLASAGSSDVFLAAYSPTGAHVWSKRFGGTGPDAATAVAVAASNELFLTGSFSDTIDFGNGLRTSAGGRDIFVAKLSNAGNAFWSRQIGGPGDDVAHAISTRSVGNSLVAGEFSQSVDFGGGALVSAGLNDIFLLELSTSGSHIGSRQIGGPGDDVATGVDVDTNNEVALTGAFSGSVDFGGGAIISAGMQDAFVLRVSDIGAHLWSKGIGGPGDDAGAAISIGGPGDVVLTGAFSGTVGFEGDTLVSAGLSDVFVVKLSSSGGLAWTKQIGGPGDDVGRAVALTPTDDVIVAGSFSQSVDFGSGALVSAGGTDAFAATWSAIGGPGDSVGIGGPGDDAALAVAVGSIVLAGAFEGTIDLGAGPQNSAGQSDGFVVHLSTVVCADPDNDGYADCACADAPLLCDCDELDPAKHPGAPEICGNSLDEDCDGPDETSQDVCENGIDDDCTGPVDCCTDGVKDGTETDVDCGGASCRPCSLGASCTNNGQCANNNCLLSPISRCAKECLGDDDCVGSSWCSAGFCTDAFCAANQYYDRVGGACMPKVPPGMACTRNASCAVGSCVAAICACDMTRECTNCLDDDSDGFADQRDVHCDDRMDDVEAGAGGSLCGNGLIEAGEVCDENNESSSCGTCNANCSGPGLGSCSGATCSVPGDCASGVCAGTCM